MWRSARGEYTLFDKHVSPLPLEFWIDATYISDEDLDNFRLWYATKKIELKS